MKYKFIYDDLVDKDLENATSYYKKISPKLAKEFLRNIREARKYIALNPKGDDVMYKQIRMHFLSQFPYHIHYYVDDQKKQIIIVAVAFAKQENLNFSKR